MVQWLIEKIKKHDREWFRWQSYMFKTRFVLWLCKRKLHIIFPFGKTAEMSKWISRNPPRMQLRSIGRDFNSIQPKTVLWDFVINAHNPILYLEFGVYEGNSMRWVAQHNKNRASGFVGFDSFDGLPEKFQNFGHGFLGIAEVPDFDDLRVDLWEGLFQQTVGAFIRCDALLTDARQKVILMDADCYSGTMYALVLLAAVLKGGDIIIFDEFAHPDHEYKALRDFVRCTGIQLECIGATDFYYHVAFQVREQ